MFDRLDPEEPYLDKMKIKRVFLTVGVAVCSLVSAIAAPTPVLLIGADGFGGKMFDEYQKELPNLTRLRQQGASTTKMRCVLPSASAINWKSMLSGSPTELHGFTTWGSRSPEIPSREMGKYGQYPGIFGIIRDQNPQAFTACFYDWVGIKYLVEEKAVSESKNTKSLDEVIPLTEAALKKQPLFIFVYLGFIDGAGHEHGWGSPEYKAACIKTDEMVGKLMKAVENSPMKDKMVIMFAADHGGINKGHGGITLDEMRIPFVMAGPGIKKNVNITDSTMIYDITSTIAKLLEVKQPQVWTGRPIVQGLDENK